MCTVTVIPQPEGFRLACNRDESRTRLAALPPRAVTSGSRQALMPIDPLSGGTWIAASDAGLVFALLNVYAAPHDQSAPPPKRSRGTIIPQLVDAFTLQQAFEKTGTIDPTDFHAFRLLLVDRQAWAEVISAGQALTRTAPAARSSPVLFTSSGLGDAQVEPPRRELFQQYFKPGQDWRSKQGAYHSHSWPDRRHLSVCMTRLNARTVSLTVVEVEATSVRMIYYPDAPDQAPKPITKVLQIASVIEPRTK